MIIVTAKRKQGKQTVYIISDGNYTWVVRREDYTKKRLQAMLGSYRKRGYKLEQDSTATQVKPERVLLGILPRIAVKKIMGLPFHDTNSVP